MNKIVPIFLFLVLILSGSVVSGAETKAFVEAFTVIGSDDRQLGTVLQTLLASRISTGSLVVTDTPAGADVVIKGAYTQIGKSFSLDVAARNSKGEVLGRCFEEGGENQPLLIAMNKLGEKLSQLLGRRQQGGQLRPPAGSMESKVMASPEPTIIRKEAKEGIAGAVSRLTGVYSSMAPFAVKDGKRQLVAVRGKVIELLELGSSVDKVAEASVGGEEKILAADTADLDGDGEAEIYLTVMRDGDLISQVWVSKNRKLVRVADGLPYFFRALSAPGGKTTLYAQQMGKTDDFFGSVYEIARGPKGYELKNPLKLPRVATIFNFNRFVDKDGIPKSIILNQDGFLIVYDDAGEEVWRSDEKYGGSESYFVRNDQQNIQFTGAASRKVFLEQRMVVTKEGDIIVPRNTGFWTVGNSRSYSRNSLHGMGWNGAVLEERWRTRDTQAYLADYFLDENAKELVLLEVVKKEGLIEKGASALSVKKIE